MLASVTHVILGKLFLINFFKSQKAKAFFLIVDLLRTHIDEMKYPAVFLKFKLFGTDLLKEQSGPLGLAHMYVILIVYWKIKSETMFPVSQIYF